MQLKLDAVKILEKSENMNKIVFELNVGSSTVVGWKKISKTESWC